MDIEWLNSSLASERAKKDARGEHLRQTRAWLDYWDVLWYRLAKALRACEETCDAPSQELISKTVHQLIEIVRFAESEDSPLSMGDIRKAYSELKAKFEAWNGSPTELCRELGRADLIDITCVLRLLTDADKAAKTDNDECLTDLKASIVSCSKYPRASSVFSTQHHLNGRTNRLEEVWCQELTNAAETGDGFFTDATVELIAEAFITSDACLVPIQYPAGERIPEDYTLTMADKRQLIEELEAFREDLSLFGPKSDEISEMASALLARPEGELCSRIVNWHNELDTKGDMRGCGCVKLAIKIIVRSRKTTTAPLPEDYLSKFETVVGKLNGHLDAVVCSPTEAETEPIDDATEKTNAQTKKFFPNGLPDDPNLIKLAMLRHDKQNENFNGMKLAREVTGETDRSNCPLAKSLDKTLRAMKTNERGKRYTGP